MFDSAATKFIKKTLFFSNALCWGFGLYIWMFVEVSCPARRQSSHYLLAEAMLRCSGLSPATMGSALLSWAPPCCHGLCPSVVGSSLLPCVIPCSHVYMGVVRTAMVMVAPPQ